MVGKSGSKKAKKRGKIEVTERRELSTSEKIKELEQDIGKTKYNKRTQAAIGLMKAKLAMLKEKAVARSKVGKAKGDDRFSVRKSGDATVVLLGFPSVGKSTLLNKLTGAKSDIGAYAFTTLNAVPGVMKYKFAKIQIVDVPGIVSGAASGRGRGKEVLGIVRNADMILVLVDALYPNHYKAILKEVYETGVRINEKKPDIRITQKGRGGILVGSTVKLTKIDINTIKAIAKEMKINNAEVLIRDDITADQFIDAIEQNKRYTKALTVITKADLIRKEKLEKLKAQIDADLVVSAEKDLGIKELREAIYQKLGFINIFLKEVNKAADMKEPLIMFKGCTIRDVCLKLHRDFVDKFKYAKVWGKSAKFGGQVLGLDHVMQDGDVLQLNMK